MDSYKNEMSSDLSEEQMNIIKKKVDINKYTSVQVHGSIEYTKYIICKLVQTDGTTLYMPIPKKPSTSF